jgi:RHS repeat-associated protein
MPTPSHKTILLATDQQRSVLNTLDANRPHPIAYTPYGHRPHENGLLSLLGFNSEPPDPLTGHYHLGNGYRQFNPVLMRFNSPDSWSPLGEGGLNAYAYCRGEPINHSDRTGHIPNPIKGILNFFGRKQSSISAEIKLTTKQIKHAELTIKNAPHEIKEIDKIINLGQKILDREAQLNATKSRSLSSLGDAPPAYELPPTYTHADTTHKIGILENKKRQLNPFDDELINDNKYYVKYLKNQRNKGVKTLEEAQSNLRTGK